MLNRLIFTCITVACLASAPALAHHGRDFILVQTVHLPQQNTVYGIGRVDYISAEHDEMEFEPALLYGATDWMTVELHAHYEKESGESLRHESIAPSLHFRLTPRGQPFSAGLIAEYEFAHEDDDADAVGLSGVFGYEKSGWNATVNVLYEKHSGSSPEWSFAAGIRRTFRESHGIGLELLDSFESDGPAEALIGYYAEFSERFTLNAGLGAGLDHEPDWAMRTAMIWRFR